MTLRERVETQGFAIATSIIDYESIDKLIGVLETGSRSNGRAGRRNLAQEFPEVRELALNPRLRALACDCLGDNAFACRILFFDKTPETNWSVPWHQDTAIAVSEQRSIDGFFGWSVKAGVPHVHPPTEVLEGMVTLRLHLDDCDETNGPLRVIPASHRQGRHDDSAIETLRQKEPPVTCACRGGDVIMMKPLLLHASSPASKPGHRRVLHLEFAATDLPAGLHWFERLHPDEASALVS